MLTKKDLNYKEVRVLLQDSDTFAFTLLTICIIAYGDQTFKVDPLTLYQYLKEDFNAELTDENENKLNALIACLVTNFFFKDLSTFKSVSQTLTEGDPGLFDIIPDDPTLIEMLWAIYEVNLAYDDTDKETFSPEILQYIEDQMLENPEDSSLSTDLKKDTYQDMLNNNIKLLRQQLLKIGLTDIPLFPKLDI